MTIEEIGIDVKVRNYNRYNSIQNSLFIYFKKDIFICSEVADWLALFFHSFIGLTYCNETCIAIEQTLKESLALYLIEGKIAYTSSNLRLPNNNKYINMLFAELDYDSY